MVLRHSRIHTVNRVYERFYDTHVYTLLIGFMKGSTTLTYTQPSIGFMKGSTTLTYTQPSIGFMKGSTILTYTQPSIGFTTLAYTQPSIGFMKGSTTLTYTQPSIGFTIITLLNHITNSITTAFSPTIVQYNNFTMHPLLI